MPAGEVGELWFRGPHVSLGYWRNPEATAAAYVAGGWFRSGDLARRDEEGFFSIAGRAKEMIISGGVNIYPAEIEAVLLQHPGVRDAAVVGLEHPTWGETGIAFVVPVAPGSADAATLLEFVGERLARFKLPKEIRRAGRAAPHRLRQGGQGRAPGALPVRPRGAIRLPIARRSPNDRFEHADPSHRGRRSAGGPAERRHDDVSCRGRRSQRNCGRATASSASTFAASCCHHGSSLRSPRPDLAGHAGDLAGLLDQAGWGSAHFIGASFGAEVALELAARQPERVRSLVLITAMDRETPEFRRGSDEMRAVLARRARRRANRRASTTCSSRASTPPPTAGREAATLAARRAQTDLLPRAWFEGVDDLLAALEGFDLTARLGLIRCPALALIAGEDRIMDSERARALATAIGAQVAIHPTAGHGLVVEDPDWVAAACLEFLDRLEPAPRKGA